MQESVCIMCVCEIERSNNRSRLTVNRAAAAACVGMCYVIFLILQQMKIVEMHFKGFPATNAAIAATITITTTKFICGICIMNNEYTRVSPLTLFSLLDQLYSTAAAAAAA